MLPSHRRIEIYDGYEIWQRQPGFEFTPVMLGKVASFIAQGAQGRFIVFAFMYSMLASLAGVEIREDRLLDEAVRTIEGAIDRAADVHHQDLTFEYHDNAWVEVSEPRWWIRTF
jgi:hypothetical protein